MAEKAVKLPPCPKCGSRHIDVFRDAYWLFCRECGFNTQPRHTLEEALLDFKNGLSGADAAYEETGKDGESG